MTPRSAPSRAIVFLALFTVQVCFGLNYFFSKFILDHLSVWTWASLRVGLSAIFLSGLALLLRRPFPRLDRKFILPLALFGVLGIFLNQALFLLGLRLTTPTNSAILTTLIPVFTLLISALFGYERLTVMRILGIGLAMLGAVSIRPWDQIRFSDQTVLGDALTVLNSLSYAFFLALSKKWIEKYDRVWATAFLFIWGGMMFVAASVPDWVHQAPIQWSVPLVAAMVFGVLGATVATYFLNMWALTYTHSSNVALFVYLQPVIAAGVSWIWFGQMISVRAALASVMIFVGVLMSIFGKHT